MRACANRAVVVNSRCMHASAQEGASFARDAGGVGPARAFRNPARRP